MEQDTDGFTSLSGGMYLSDANHHVVAQDQAEVLVNATVRSGWASPRPAFVNVPIYWDHQFAQGAFQNGVFQGSARYDSDAGPRIAYACDGHLLTFDTENNIMRLLSPGARRCFDRRTPFVWLQQRGRWLIAQDGVNPPVIIDGDTASLNEDPFNGIPTGCMMADGWGRLAVVGSDRARVYLSDHEYDPNSTPLSFTDDSTYYLNARYFQTPKELGKIVGIAFAPSFNLQDDLGPLMVFCEKGTRVYDVRVPREQWISKDIASTMLPTIGACSHGGIVARGNDVLFSDQNGRIQTFKVAISKRENARIGLADQGVYNLYRKENQSLRRWRQAERFDDRILTTVWPERVRMANGNITVRHRGFVCLEEDHMSERPIVWNGLWTGIYPVAITTSGTYSTRNQSPRERCFCVSLDDDRKHRIYELTRESGPDLAPDPKRVAMWVVPKWMDWNAIFKRKSFHSAAMQLGSVRGRLEIKAWWQTAGASPKEWFTHHEARGDCMIFGDNCNLVEPEITGVPRITLPAPDENKDFYRARPWFRFLGNADLNECVIGVDLNTVKPQKSTVCKAPKTGLFIPRSCNPNFWEGHSSQAPAEEQLNITIC